MDDLALNIVILPDKRVQNTAVSLSELISTKIETEFTLNSTNFLPHITVFQGRFLKTGLKSLKKMLKDAVSRHKTFSINLDAIEVVYETFISWHCIKCPQLQSIHEDIIEPANQHRSTNDHPTINLKLTLEDQSDLKKYGMIRVNNRYTPHITLSKLIDPKDKEILTKIIEFKKITFTAEKMALCRLGPHGTVQEVLETYSFVSRSDNM